MILVDTSVWIDHLRKGVDELARTLETGDVLVHPFVIGELALGGLKNRASILDALHGLGQTEVASHDEVMAFIERYELHGLGIGYGDAHLLAGVLLTPGSRLWTRDKRLHAVASKFGIAATA